MTARILAIPALAAAELLRELAPDTASALQTVPYAPICVVCTAYRRDRVRHDMNGFGFLVPRNQGKRVLGSIWTSTIFPSQAPAGMVLLRSMYGGATDYMLCMETADSCSFNTTIGMAMSCTDVCTSFGGTCVGAELNDVDLCTSTGAGTCDQADVSDIICVCSL